MAPGKTAAGRLVRQNARIDTLRDDRSRFAEKVKEEARRGLTEHGVSPMLLPRSTGLAAILPKTIGFCLESGPPMLFNWDHKLRELIAGICLSRSLVLQSIAQTRPGHVRTIENELSAFLGRDRLDFDGPQKACVARVLRRLGRRRLWSHRGKAVLIIDSTSHAKARSRGKKRPMPGKGKVRLHNLPTDETLLVPGYQELWVGILMADRTVMPITRRLWSENGPECASLNLVESAEIRRAADIVREALKLEVILVADSGFRRKELLHWLKEVEGMDFVIRIEGKLTVRQGGSKGLLSQRAPWWPKRLTLQWREKSKRVLLSDVTAHRVVVTTESKEEVSFNALCLTPVKENKDPMFLATTLTTETAEDLTKIVRLYSWRWGIETFFWMFKQGFNGGSWRVFSCWEAIDRLLAAAHMAYLVLVLLAAFARRGGTAQTRALMGKFTELLRSRFARPPEMTLGRLFRLIALDFPSPRLPGAV